MKLKTIANTVENITGVNIFEQTRRRDVIELRSMVNTYLSKTLNMKLMAIVNDYKKNGYNTTHPSVIHSINTYPTHSFYNRDLELIYESLLNDTKLNILNKVQNLTPEQVEKVEAIINE